MLTRWFMWFVIILIGAVILSPAIALIGMDPLPGDFTFTFQNTHIYMPLTTSFIVCAALVFLFLLLSRR